jgi:hypothetical protein
VFIIQYFEGFQVWTYGVACWLGGAAVTDLLITGSLVWILLNSKRGIRRTNNMCVALHFSHPHHHVLIPGFNWGPIYSIDRLISLTIETNGLTFTVAMLDLILFSAFKYAF